MTYPSFFKTPSELKCHYVKAKARAGEATICNFFSIGQKQFVFYVLFAVSRLKRKCLARL